MNLKDWDKLSPEEQQKMLDEGELSAFERCQLGIKGPECKYVEIEKQGKCAAGLLELRNSLKQEIKDEHEASSRYSEAATKLGHYKQGVKGDILMMMSTEEMMHYHMLNYIVDHITRECGE